jgi:hypothetical protein
MNAGMGRNVGTAAHRVKEHAKSSERIGRTKDIPELLNPVGVPHCKSIPVKGRSLSIYIKLH